MKVLTAQPHCAIDNCEKLRPTTAEPPYTSSTPPEDQIQLLQFEDHTLLFAAGTPKRPRDSSAKNQ
ncbi:MAG TPA: hypothetical protein DEF45_26035 [Rhodopirellula sp.]|nr:MAG: hypothetical protein CBD74_09885 [Saprospirales bacterium TMED214]HBV66470.1 hypothetical protein [Rhodopirellula sp.]